MQQLYASRGYASPQRFQILKSTTLRTALISHFGLRKRHRNVSARGRIVCVDNSHCSPVLHCARHLFRAAEFTQTLRLCWHVAGEIPGHNVHDYQSGRKKGHLTGSASFGDIQADPSGAIKSVDAPAADSEWPIVSSRLLPSRGLEITSHGENETIIVVLELINAKAGSARFGNPPGGAFLLVKPIIMHRIEQHMPQ